MRQGVRPRTSAGLQDASADLLCALSEEERDLLEAVTKHGYTLHTAIMALQRTGPKSPDQVPNTNTYVQYTHICTHSLNLCLSTDFELPDIV